MYVGGHPLAMPVSFQFLARLCQAGNADEFIDSLPDGWDVTETAVADAYPTMPGSPVITGFRTPGHTGTEFAAFFADAIEHKGTTSPGYGVTQETMAGVRVSILQVGPQVEYMYARDDEMFLISGANVEQVAIIVTALAGG